MRRKGSSVAVVATIAVLTTLIPSMASAQTLVGEMCYVVADDRSVGGEGRPDILFELDIDAGTETEVGETGTAHIEAIDFTAPVGGTLFAIDEDEEGSNEGVLGTIDTASGAFTSLGSTVGFGDGAFGTIRLADVDGLSFDPTDGSLWGSVRRKADPTDLDVLIKIDPITGELLPGVFGGDDYIALTSAGPDLFDVDDLAIDDDGTMYAIANKAGSEDHLVTVDRTTGVMTVVAKLDTTDIEGLAFSAVDDHLWGTTGHKRNNDLIRIEKSGATSIAMDLDLARDYEAIACQASIREDVPVAVSAGCFATDDPARGRVRVLITDPATGDKVSGAASVVVRDPSGAVEDTFDASGGFNVGVLDVGTYTWDATAADGFTIEGPDSGSFEVLLGEFVNPDPASCLRIPPAGSFLTSLACGSTSEGLVVEGLRIDGVPTDFIEARTRGVGIEPMTVSVSGPGVNGRFGNGDAIDIRQTGTFTWSLNVPPGLEVTSSPASGSFDVTQVPLACTGVSVGGIKSTGTILLILGLFLSLTGRLRFDLSPVGSAASIPLASAFVLSRRIGRSPAPRTGLRRGGSRRRSHPLRT